MIFAPDSLVDFVKSCAAQGGFFFFPLEAGELLPGPAADADVERLGVADGFALGFGGLLLRIRDDDQTRDVDR